MKTESTLIFLNTHHGLFQKNHHKENEKTSQRLRRTGIYFVTQNWYTLKDWYIFCYIECTPKRHMKYTTN